MRHLYRVIVTFTKFYDLAEELLHVAINLRLVIAFSGRALAENHIARVSSNDLPIDHLYLLVVLWKVAWSCANTHNKDTLAEESLGLGGLLGSHLWKKWWRHNYTIRAAELVCLMEYSLGKYTIDGSTSNDVLDGWLHQKWVLIVFETASEDLSVSIEVLLHAWDVIWDGWRHWFVLLEVEIV